MAPTQLNPTEQDALVKQIGLTLLRAAPADWQQLIVRYRAVGRYHEMTGEIHTANDEHREWAVSHDVATLFARLRAGMHRDGRGTWFNARYQLDRPSSYNLDYDREQPQWDTPPPPQAYADELKIFPRTEENVPEWLLRRLAGVGPEQSGPRFRIARIFDGMGPAGRPVINRGEVDEPTANRLLNYLDGAPVVVPGRGFDVDRLANDSPQNVPVAFHSDGTWIWPAAVNYYLRVYGVPPEPELLEHIQATQFTPPAVPEETQAAAASYLTRSGPAQPPAPGAPVPGAAGPGTPPPGTPAPGTPMPGAQDAGTKPTIDGPPAGIQQPAGMRPAEAGAPAAGVEPADNPQPTPPAGAETDEGARSTHPQNTPVAPPAQQAFEPPESPFDEPPPPGAPDDARSGIPGVEGDGSGEDFPENALEVTRVDGSLPILGADGLPVEEGAEQPPATRGAEPPTSMHVPEVPAFDEPGADSPDAVEPVGETGPEVPGIASPDVSGRDMPGMDARERDAVTDEPRDGSEPPFARESFEAPLDEPRFDAQPFEPGRLDPQQPESHRSEPHLSESQLSDSRPFDERPFEGQPRFDQPRFDEQRFDEQPFAAQPFEDGPPAGEPAPVEPHDSYLAPEQDPARADRSPAGSSLVEPSLAEPSIAEPAPARPAPRAEPPSDPLELLRYRLVELGVPDSAYRIGAAGEQAWCLEETEGGWRVGWYDTELTSPAVFGDAQDAAAFMLGKLLLGPVEPGEPSAPTTGFTAPQPSEPVREQPAEQPRGYFEQPEPAERSDVATRSTANHASDDIEVRASTFGKQLSTQLHRSVSTPQGYTNGTKHVEEGSAPPKPDPAPTPPTEPRAQRLRTEIPPEVSAAALSESQQPSMSDDEQSGPGEGGQQGAGSMFTEPEPSTPQPAPVPTGARTPPGAGGGHAATGSTKTEERTGQGARRAQHGASQHSADKSSGGQGRSSTSRWPIQPLAGEPPLTLFRGKQMINLPAGSELDRFGEPEGNLTYADGTPFEQRSLVPEWVNRQYHVYRLRHPLQVLTGTAIPWFDQPGGGTAYLLPQSIDELLDAGALVELEPGDPPVGGY